MKSVLVIFSQGPLAGQNLLEAISATMVLATYGLHVKVCLINDAINLLIAPVSSITQPQAFKPAHPMLESFEFYDLLPVWISRPSTSQQQQLKQAQIEHETIELNPALLGQFDQVLYW